MRKTLCRELVAAAGALSAQNRHSRHPVVVSCIVALALNSKQVVNECLTGIAMRKKGLNPSYLSPLTSDDNRS